MTDTSIPIVITIGIIWTNGRSPSNSVEGCVCEGRTYQVGVEKIQIIKRCVGEIRCINSITNRRI